MKSPYSLIVFFWLALGLYFGTGGMTKLENSDFLNKKSNPSDTVETWGTDGALHVSEFAANKQRESDRIDKMYPWIVTLPSFLVYIITACAFGLLGSIINILLQIIITGRNVAETNIISLPLLGILTGFVVLAISYVIPNSFFSREVIIKPNALMFLCMLCGIFTTEFFEKLKSIFTKITTK